MSQDSAAIVQFANNGFLVGITPSKHAVAIDTEGDRKSAPTPIELLLLALGSCTAADVIGILQKKRARVTDYRVEIRGERRQDHPRSFERMKVHHIIKGYNIPRSAVAQAVELSDTKYCSVAASLRPTAEILSTFETIQEDL